MTPGEQKWSTRSRVHNGYERCRYCTCLTSSLLRQIPNGEPWNCCSSFLFHRLYAPVRLSSTQQRQYWRLSLCWKLGYIKLVGRGDVSPPDFWQGRVWYSNPNFYFNAYMYLMFSNIHLGFAIRCSNRNRTTRKWKPGLICHHSTDHYSRVSFHSYI